MGENRMAALGEETGDLLTLIERGDAAGLEAALAAGADAKACDRLGVSALTHAAAGGDAAAVRLLLDHGAEVNRTSQAGNAPLMAAAARGHLAVMKALLEAGADPEHRNKWGLGAADWAKWPANVTESLALLHNLNR